MSFLISANKKLCKGTPEKFYSLVEESFRRAGIPREFYKGEPLSENHLTKAAFGITLHDEKYEVDAMLVAQRMADLVHSLKIAALYGAYGPDITIDPKAVVYLDNSTSIVSIKIDEGFSEDVKGILIVPEQS